MSLSSRKFFDRLYKENSYQGSRLIKSSYFRQRQMMRAEAADINAYLRSEKAYLKCRRIMAAQSIIFLDLDINDFSDDRRLTGRFDVINLSNVLNYLTHNIGLEDIIGVLAKIIRPLANRLKPRGVFFTYSYSPTFYSQFKKPVPPPSRLPIIRAVAARNGYRVSWKRFSGVNHQQRDRINIFQLR